MLELMPQKGKEETLLYKIPVWQKGRAGMSDEERNSADITDMAEAISRCVAWASEKHGTWHLLFPVLTNCNCDMDKGTYIGFSVDASTKRDPVAQLRWLIKKMQTYPVERPGDSAKLKVAFDLATKASEVKKCDSCKHFEYVAVFMPTPNFPSCKHPDGWKGVEAEAIGVPLRIDWARQAKAACGPTGALFEQIYCEHDWVTVGGTQGETVTGQRCQKCHKQEWF